ncbi:alpha/beta hydrolase fold domain-containing protein [Deinococcus hopiensis]|uniref:alpha/beta hydrolase fold domain-containing protein n=1 Tax=Deinococcus hopiensis TaxID=309885 RepID=UPI00148354CD|nr:alpha/beta hydrolase [Deinococcus hopiensis]
MTFRTDVRSGMLVYTVTPRGPRPRGNVVYIHGGGWVNQILPLHWRLTAQIAAEVCTTVTVPIYPKVPGGTADTVARSVVQLVLDSICQGEPTGLSGDSAGGQIALSAALVLRGDHGTVLPQTVLISPALDLTFTNPDIARVQPRDPLIASEGAGVFTQLWQGQLPLTDPRVSPLFGDLKDLGPITVLSGTHDILNPDARLLARNAKDAGTALELIEQPGGLHVYPLLPTRSGRAAWAFIVERWQMACCP